MNYDLLLGQITEVHGTTVSRAIQTVNQALVLRNWTIGAHIVEFEQRGADRAAYGTRLLPRLSADLVALGIPGSSRQELERCRRCYQTYPQLLETLRSSGSSKPLITLSDSALEICSTVSSKFTAEAGPSPLEPHLLLKLSWSHLGELLRLQDPWQRAFYEAECLRGRWSVRELQRQIGSLLFERTGLSTDKQGLLTETRQQATTETLADLIRDPYVLEFTGLAERPRYRESDLEQALLDHLQGFLLELGTGFCLEARQKRITVGNEHDWIDLVFYHRRLRCHLLIDLKVRAFSHADAGQMNFYLNWWQANAMDPGDQPPVGLILCSAKDAVKVQYATAGLDQQLFVSRYLVELPKPEALQRLIDEDRARIEEAAIAYSAAGAHP